MDALQLLTWSLILYLFASLVSLFLLGLDRLAIKLSGITSLVGGVIGIISGITHLHAGVTLVARFATPFDFADLTLRMDSLSAFMVLVISLLVVVCSLYSLTYMREYEGKGAAAMGFFMNLFIASMVALLVMDNAFWFIVLFEMMSLSSWFLVIARQDKTSINAGMLYFFIAHAGSVLIMIAFLLMGRESGSLDFASFRTLSLSPGLASAVFLLAFFGFGAKAGMMPLHSWLPRAHPAAPSHASALMSGVMVKIGIFGILKVAMDLLAEQDIKRLLAWSTVENVGIILLAVGVAMVGLSLHDPLLTVVGLLGALFHLLNHALFKGLLFLGAGAIISRLHTHDMEKMGALAKRMPWTAAACLIGCLAISAIPPLNGFISEWYTWQSLFSLSRVEAVALQLAGPIAMVMLAVTGGLAVMCFVKMYGITFCGAPRSTHAEEAQEVPNTMIVAMLLLAALCVFIALSASWLAPKIMHIAHAFTNTPPVTVASGIALVPGTFHTRVTPSLLLLLLLAMPLLPGLYWLWCRSRRAAFRRTGDAWACGYGWENAMAPSGNGVMQPLRVVFCALFRLRQQLDPTLRLNKGLAHVTARAQSTESFWDERVIRPIVSATQRLAKEIQHLQSGDFRLYCLYVVAALVVLLIAIAV
ncbi:hydrogenase-4 subunit B [Escherichia coli]|uniref:hydrogenase-4 subunit B n=1 Tax=Enterobacteriaceae TaxID=543 RepID=UPI000B95409A|nr:MULTISPECIES: hydrogenase-4 subunit B [Enterobacteriaceae]OYL31898.1 hydrogenase 4 subunit B [Shigella sonnei]EFK8339156.1 hydrogenase-4 subunit B [Escherichia coli]EHS3451764.1 hydrogenase-4 subunit B [Escherichia coli]EHS3461398.1 hydrogenase-4 subunit B [Escherichia coli]EHS3475858.1 hydrogenase-4 subunit B [Escherichia coli]